MHKLSQQNHFSQLMPLLPNLTAKQSFLLFFLKMKPGRGLTQGIEVQFLVSLTNYGYPNFFSNTFFPHNCLQSVNTKKEQVG